MDNTSQMWAGLGDLPASCRRALHGPSATTAGKSIEKLTHLG